MKTNLVQHYIDHIMPNMDGWCSRDKAVDLANTVFRDKPKVSVEIGVFGGRSLIAMALAIAHVEGATVIGIDPWKTEDSIRGFEDENKEWWGKIDHEKNYQECVAAIKFLGVKNIRLFRLTAAQALAQGHIPASIDFLHIDGNHCEESSCFDVVNYTPRVPRGKLVFLDDMDWKTTGMAQKILAESCDLERTIVSGTSVCGVYRKR